MATITEPTKIKLEFKEAVYMYGGDYNQGYEDGKSDGIDEGKKIGYDEGVEFGKANAPREERSVTYKANGSYEVLPTSSNLLMEKVNVVVDIPDDGSYSEGYTDGYAEGEAYGKANAPSENLSVTLTSNGTFNYPKPQDKYYADVEVVVNVPSEKTPTQEKSITIKENGTEVISPDDGFALDKVTVTTQIDTRLPEQTKEVTIRENGTTNVLPDSGYTLAGVSVTTDIDTRLPEQEKTLEVTENIVYEVTPDDGYALSKVTVTGNVAGSGGGDDELVSYKGVTEPIAIPTSNLNYFRASTYIKEIDFKGVLNSNDNLSYLFDNYCGTHLTIKNLDTSKATQMISMFGNCVRLAELNLPNFNTSKVENLRDCFRRCQNITSFDLSSWDTSNVTNMSSMFQECTYLTEIKGLENWDTSKVTNMSMLFYGSTSLASLDLSSWDTSNVTNMSSMFSTQFSGYVTFGENWASNPQLTVFYFTCTTVKKESLLDLANKIADKSDTSIYTGTNTVYFSKWKQSSFTEDELTALAGQFTAKNWTLVWQ